MKRLLVTLIAVMAWGQVAFGQNLTIEQCMDEAMKSNPDIRKAQESLAAAEERRYQAFTSFLPSLSASGLYTHLDRVPPRIDLAALAMPGAPQPRIFGNPLLQYGFQDNYTANIKVSQPLFAGGRNWRTYQAQDAEYQARKADLETARDRVRVDVVRAFYGVMVAEAMRSLSLEATGQLEQHLKRVGNFMKSGLATEYDYLKTEVQLYSWSPRVAQADRDLNNTLRRLKLLLGRSPDSSLTTIGNLEYVPYTDQLTVEQAKGTALESRPEIILAQSMKNSASFASRVRLSSVYPQLNFQYNYNLINQQGDFSLDRDAWMSWWDVRFMVSWEIFSFGRSISEYKESMRRISQASIDLDALQSRIASEVEDVFEYRLQSRKAVELWQKNVELAKRGYQIAEDKYRNGTMTNVDVLDSQVALIDARVQYLKALYDYNVARAEFVRVIKIQ